MAAKVAVIFGDRQVFFLSCKKLHGLHLNGAAHALFKISCEEIIRGVSKVERFKC